MSKEVALFEGQALPAHLQDFGDGDANIESGSKINALSTRGKVFRVVYEGEEKPITRYNEETGDREPVSTVSVIVINQGPFGARRLFEGAYSADNSSAPMCFSLDGKVPDAASDRPQARSCAECPHAVKGSKVTPNGTLTTACQLQRRLSVVPSTKPESPALLLSLAATSAYDPDTKGAENGWMAWRQYLDFLNARGVRHTAQLVTKLRFDPNPEYPKLLFKAERFLTEDEAKVIAERIKSDEVNAMLFPDPDAKAPEPVAEPAQVEEEDAPIKPASAASDDDEQWGDEEEVPKPAPKKKAAPRRKAPAKKAAADDGEDDTPARKTVAAGKATKTEAPAAEKSAVDDLLDDWDA